MHDPDESKCRSHEAPDDIGFGGGGIDPQRIAEARGVPYEEAVRLAAATRAITRLAEPTIKPFTCDDGDGVTQISLEVWKRSRARLGRIVSVRASIEPLLVRIVRSPDGSQYDLGWTLRIEGEHGILYLSGCNCGFGGEGPNGTRRILEELGVAPDRARELMLMREFMIDLSEEGAGDDAGD